MSTTRIESDLIGTREIPSEDYYGIQSVRAIENFPITGIGLNRYPELVKYLGVIKKAAAIANGATGKISKEVSEAIVKACDDVIAGKYDNQFIVDVIQGGAGTSTNMNANEVIANIALEYMGHERGEYQYCSPNDHVNGSQSTNDAYPCATRLAIYAKHLQMLPVIDKFIESLDKKAVEFSSIIKMGRTQLQDAVPMTLGLTFKAFADGMRNERRHIEEAAKELLVVNMGATAIGTGICSTLSYREECFKALREITGWDVQLANDFVQATSDATSIMVYSGALRTMCTTICKICNDLRLMSSGPRCGLNEINLPKMQPGSSIMPGKVNPVMPEVMNQICYRVIGNDTCIMLGAQNAQLELNVMEPVMVYAALESIELLTNGFEVLRTLCIDGITANAEHCNEMVEHSIGIVTALVPVLGYKPCSNLAKESLATGKGVIELIREKGLLTEEQIKEFMNPKNMII
ncbi:MAG: aspartate ammonia-lyase [Candidatus Limimorpha sp.]|nr:aspartate ammonia-lyase [Bacteroidales bacterium]MCI7377828.1 aspartate ammonia-lyase [Bacteroidales bacterium]MDD5978743.1 aspartate ammonia-lyase [Bacteroidales bacterium]MDD7276158.1 aspartate ammonia-lyase [Bacteroidales bacterium]MDY6074631.1 aspartate ammonia-lyase [Bacteroidales bacterium]